MANSFKIPIFKPGVHKDSEGNVNPWTDKDMKRMVQNFNSKVFSTVPIKVGHTSDAFNKKVADALDLPVPLIEGEGKKQLGAVRIGEVTKLDYDKKTLNAVVTPANKKVEKLYTAGYFNSVSPEIRVNRDINGNRDPALGALAMLGAQRPALAENADVLLEDGENADEIYMFSAVLNDTEKFESRWPVPMKEPEKDTSETTWRIPVKDSNNKTVRVVHQRAGTKLEAANLVAKESASGIGEFARVVGRGIGGVAVVLLGAAVAKKTLGKRGLKKAKGRGFKTILGLGRRYQDGDHYIVAFSDPYSKEEYFSHVMAVDGEAALSYAKGSQENPQDWRVGQVGLFSYFSNDNGGDTTFKVAVQDTESGNTETIAVEAPSEEAAMDMVEDVVEPAPNLEVESASPMGTSENADFDFEDFFTDEDFEDDDFEDDDEDDFEDDEDFDEEDFAAMRDFRNRNYRKGARRIKRRAKVAAEKARRSGRGRQAARAAGRAKGAASKAGSLISRNKRLLGIGAGVGALGAGAGYIASRRSNNSDDFDDFDEDEFAELNPQNKARLRELRRRQGRKKQAGTREGRRAPRRGTRGRAAAAAYKGGRAAKSKAGYVKNLIKRNPRAAAAIGGIGAVGAGAGYLAGRRRSDNSDITLSDLAFSDESNEEVHFSEGEMALYELFQDALNAKDEQIAELEAGEKLAFYSEQLGHLTAVPGTPVELAEKLVALEEFGEAGEEAAELLYSQWEGMQEYAEATGAGGLTLVAGSEDNQAGDFEKRVRKFSEENDVEYSEAYITVSKQFPELKRAYDKEARNKASA